MKDYKEFTIGWLIFVFVVPIQLLLTYLYLNNMGDRPMDINSYTIITLILVLVCLLFFGLTTTITSDLIVVSFGIGLIKKKIKLKRIMAVDIVQSPWYYGWGIRLIPNGTLYNMSGTDGVELKFNDSDQIIRIGTRNPLLLKNEIEKRML
ncbi:hypothetical protein [Adhaeribacter radiodurans]|uniref:Uncharacterized protein n=1 Tax=Adhaeribacter radiodurans TaxID=2745197 RepID=A0A7L7L5I6_9BACT|nr:hypothetical protein [Adhaeribacter radiodurans]QMU28068.1 hypothetical protein HUW48_08415 [Adhaeribacter radiodurans]